MALPRGVYKAYTKDMQEYYRVSITYKNKHISLGSYTELSKAATAYQEADALLHSTCDISAIDTSTCHAAYEKSSLLSFEKWIILNNFKDSGIYIKTPIYLCSKHFIYFISPTRHLLFDVDDLFYYSNHKIMARDGYLFVNDHGMQTSILFRYGIRNHAVCGRDYIFCNGDICDYRYTNLQIINKYTGVQSFFKNGLLLFKVKIHVHGDYVVGTYKTEKEAAIAYNKAVNLLHSKGMGKNYITNYIEDISSIEYAAIYNAVKISHRLRNIICE